MTGYLVDTHIALWWWSDARRLTAVQREVIATAPVVMASAASIWEVAIKAGLGRLTAPDAIADTFVEEGFTLLPIAPEHAEAVRDLPPHHRDPFDRMLVAQARCEGLTLLTADPAVRRYDVATL